MAKIPSDASPIDFAINDILAGIRQLGSTVKGGTPIDSTSIKILLANAIYGLYANNVNAGGNAKLPISGELNGLFFSVFRLLAHIQQNGIQEYNADIEYPAFALAKSVDGEALYQSKVNLNKGNALTDTTKWLSLSNISDLQYLLQATTTNRGTSRFATNAEVLAGTATNIGITPAGLNSLNVACSLYKTANTTVATQADFIINYSSNAGVEVNTNNCYNQSTNRFQPTQAGWYYVFCGMDVYFQNTAAYLTNNGLYKNGVFYFMSNKYAPIGTTSFHQTARMVYMNGTTDYLQHFGLFGTLGSPVSSVQISGTIMTFFQAFKIF